MRTRRNEFGEVVRVWTRSERAAEAKALADLATRRKQHRLKWSKIRSGKRVLGMIHPVGEVYAWKSSRGDSGVSSSRQQAIDNAIRSHAGSGTADGFRRQYSVSVDD